MWLRMTTRKLSLGLKVNKAFEFYFVSSVEVVCLITEIAVQAGGMNAFNGYKIFVDGFLQE